MASHPPNDGGPAAKQSEAHRHKPAKAPFLPGAARRGPIAWMARNSVAANLLMLVLMLAGVFGISRIKQEVFPEFDLEMITVTLPYPGASPAEVEQGMVLAVEEAVRGLDGVKRVTSVSSEGSGRVVIELLLGADVQQAFSDIKGAVDRIQSFPQDAERHTIAIVSRKREVISLVIAGDQPLGTLHAIAERARADLLAKDEITQVELFGTRPLEVSITIPRETLEGYGLSLSEVAQQIRAASVELPGGDIETQGGDLLVRMDDRRRRGYEFANITLRGTAQGATIRLGDIATITDGYQDTDAASFYNGQRAVRVTAYRVGDETPIEVAATVRAYLKTLRTQVPSDITLAIWRDDSEILQGRIDLLVRNAQMGLILVLITLALFLDLHLAGWVALGIPISFLGAFALMPGFDLSINMVTLFAFIVTLGMVVDDAIIVGENAFSRMERGVQPLRAAIEGAQEMVVPVTFSILTSLAAFAPLFFVPGTMGKIFRLIPAVVCLVLVLSLVESFWILPAHLGHSKFIRSTNGNGDSNTLSSKGPRRTWLGAIIERLRRRVSAGLDRFSNGAYQPALTWVLRHRYISVASALALFAIVVGLVVGGWVPFRFFPRLEGDLVVASARLPFGAPIERTLYVREQLEASLNKVIDEGELRPTVRGVFARVGEGARIAGGPMSGGRATGSHVLSIEVNLVPSDQRAYTSAQFTRWWSAAMPPLAGVEVLKFDFSTGPGAGAAVDVQLSHHDADVLATVSEELTQLLQGYSDLTNIENAYSAGKPQLNYQLREQALTLGLTGNAIARQLRDAFFGAEALREQRDRNEVRVMVRLPKSQRSSEHDLERFLVRSPAGGHVPLSYVASFDRGRAPTSITREEGKRVIDVTAELRHGVPSAREILNSLRREVLPDLTSRYPGLTAELVGQQRHQAESFESLGQNYILAMCVIFTLLAIPFRSYTQPLVIMSAIPFGFVGAVFGHLLMGYGMSIISLMGVIALSGVVVNDSLVLMDAVNRRRQEGYGPWDALLWAGHRRLRPIVLTSLTTFFGLLPMIFEGSVQARFLIPMAISLGFGVLFATVIVLLIVPALYMVLEDGHVTVRRQLARRHKHQLQATTAAAAAAGDQDH